MNCHVIHLDETTSTNTYLASYTPPSPTEVTVVTAEHQSAGRGQTGNTWESERGVNLLFSIMVQPQSLPATSAFLLSEAIALSIREAVASFLTRHSSFISVKWPNDIYVGDRKIAGILIENTLCGQYVQRSIIGCGVNVNQQVFHSDAPNPVSLYQLIGQNIDRQALLNDIITVFLRRYETLTLPLHTEYLAALYRRTGFHPYRDAHGLFLAEIVDVELTGHLLLRDESGHLRRYAFKEVEYRYKNLRFFDVI